MNEETKEALEESIEHWERMLEKGPVNSQEEPSGDDCALCGMFGGEGSCVGCPVKEATGKTGCYGTPWADANPAFDDYFEDDPDSVEDWECAANAEIAFLKSLREEPTDG